MFYFLAFMVKTTYYILLYDESSPKLGKRSTRSPQSSQPPHSKRNAIPSSHGPNRPERTIFKKTPVNRCHRSRISPIHPCTGDISPPPSIPPSHQLRPAVPEHHGSIPLPGGLLQGAELQLLAVVVSRRHQRHDEHGNKDCHAVNPSLIAGREAETTVQKRATAGRRSSQMSSGATFPV